MILKTLQAPQGAFYRPCETCNESRRIVAERGGLVIGDVEAPSPSLSDIIKEVGAIQRDWERNGQYDYRDAACYVLGRLNSLGTKGSK